MRMLAQVQGIIARISVTTGPFHLIKIIHVVNLIYYAVEIHFCIKIHGASKVKKITVFIR